MGKTKIEWAEHTWSPVTGCSPVSEGCRNCFAKRMARRLAGRYGYPRDGKYCPKCEKWYGAQLPSLTCPQCFTQLEVSSSFDVTLHPDRLDVPLRRKKPTTYFVCSMSDFFHPAVPLEFQNRIFSVIRRCPQHTFQILTKRADQMAMMEHTCGIPQLSNLWLGVSCENQATADERIPTLLQIPAAVHYVSLEPLLDRINLLPFLPPSGPDKAFFEWGDSFWNDGKEQRYLDWIIVGGESGPGARPMHPQWARDIRDQCQAASTPYFFKQWGAWLPIDQGAPMCDASKIHLFGDLSSSRRVGKKAAGHLLDGRTWSEMPNVGGDE